MRQYADKRHFERTPEPQSFSADEGAGPLRFCIQKHAATRLHYDLRLEFDGSLKSWAVPKGLSLDPLERHLAVHVEDHPLSYAEFEGIIPKGEYGGGEIIVWDIGHYSPDEEGLCFHDRVEAQRQMREGLRNGKISISLQGQKLKGSWALVRTNEEKREWLVIKHRDFSADENGDGKLSEASVLSGRTIEDVRAGKKGTSAKPLWASYAGAVVAPMPRTLLPMSPSETAKAFSDPQWTFDLKLDGIRTIAFVQAGVVRLVSRNGKDVTAKFPSLSFELAALDNCVLDGEIVVFDANGKPSFQSLMQRFQLQGARDIARFDRTTRATYCVFDLLYLGEADLRRCALQDRRAALEGLNPASPSVRLLDTFPGEGILLHEHAAALGFEGIVAKRLSSTYQDGRRSTDWLKVKDYHTEEFLICGFTIGSGMRESTFGALILGRREEDGKLRFCGGVGGGFSDAQLEQMRPELDRIRTNTPTIEGPIEINGKPIWVEPTLWAEVRFMTWTEEGRLRFPVFVRLRPDLSTLETLPEATVTAKPVSDIDSILEQIADSKDDIELHLGGLKIRLSSLSKVLWPAVGGQRAVTKRDLISYYARVSEWYLYHLRDRPISLVRLPEGLGGEQFFQKHIEKGLPEFVETVPIYSSSGANSKPYLRVNNLPTLVWLAQMATFEIHPWYSRIAPPEKGEAPFGSDTGSSDEALDASALNYPDFLVIDLDPNIPSGTEVDPHEPELNRKAWDMVVQVAVVVKQTLDALGMHGYPKTSGKSGLHIYLPLMRLYRYEEVRAVAETLGRHIERQKPELVTMEWSVKKRPQKVFFDHNQNVQGKTLCAPYSTRIVSGARVSMPLTWSALESLYPAEFTIFNVPELLASSGDAWRGILDDRQRLPGT